MRLPDCYQANDRRRPIADATPTRDEAGLPETGFVFCCFNNNYKITPEVFAVWMRLLRRVEGSVLWLFEDNPAAARNLRREAERRGVAAARLVFAPRLAPDAHLARHRLADLFVDTLPYNAHTTASDALWAGLPVLTVHRQRVRRPRGRQPAARRRPARAGDRQPRRSTRRWRSRWRRRRRGSRRYRARLARKRASCPLFDTERFRRHLEAAYVDDGRAAAARRAAGGVRRGSDRPEPASMNPPDRLDAHAGTLLARPALALACAALLALGTLRMLAIVLHDPLLGYANQFDMIRTSACVDLYPDLPAAQRYAGHPWAPVAQYVPHARADAGCYPTTGVAIVALAKGLVGIAQAAGAVTPERFPLRAVGVLDAAILAALAIAFVIAERRRPWACVGHAAAYAFVLADPATTLWFNTLYTEAAGAIAAYATLGLLALPAAQLGERRAALALAVALVAFALARQQYMAFAVVPLILAAPAMWRRSRGIWLGTALALAAAAWLQAGWLAALPSIRVANVANVYLGAVLPAVRDEPRALATLGLPETCRVAIGGGAYVGMGGDAALDCPAIARAGRLDFLRLAAGDPSLPLRVLLRGLPEAQAWWQHQLGVVAGRRYGELAAEVGWLARSPADAIERLPLPGFLFVVGALAAAALVAAVAWLRTARRAADDDGFVRCVFALACLGLYVVASGILGDGYEDVAKHALLLHMATLALALVGIGRLAAQPWDATRRAAPAVGAAAALALALAVAMHAAAREWPMARGVVTAPATRQADGSVYPLRGWALDPFGVDAVVVAAYASLEAKRPVARWEAPASGVTIGAFGESLGRYYPTYPDSTRGGFAVDVPREAIAAGGRCLRTSVRSHAGVTTEIDRRCLTP